MSDVDYAELHRTPYTRSSRDPALPHTPVNRIGAPAVPKVPLFGAHPRYPRYQDGACAALRVALAYEVRKRRESRTPAMPLISNPENRPPGMNQTARSVTK